MALDSSLAKPTKSPALRTQWTGLKKTPSPLLIPSSPPFAPPPKPLALTVARSHQSPNRHPFPRFLTPSSPLRPPIPATPVVTVSAGRSKKKPGGRSPGRIEGNAEVRRLARENARRRTRRLAENLFYRRQDSRSSNHPDSFTDDELEMIGLGYDRFVRFMQKDDPRLRRPSDWYKYGRYGPYSWRGVVVGPPIRGRFSDDRVTLIGEVRDHEEWDEIEQFEMSSQFSTRLAELDAGVGFRYHWVFVRHPKWRPTELPWEQWTLACEVAVEAGKEERLDKWRLMGRLGNKTRAAITQCAAWVRPDIIYVKRPVYQCRFEPQEDFFRLLAPLLDPETENEYPCELKRDDGGAEMCTYFGGLCKLVKASPKAYVDDVVKAYEKLSDEGKSRCLEFLLTNHPMELLHPYTKEWKAKLEELELGCDAPDESEGDDDGSETQITDWIEDDAEGDNDGEDDANEDGEVIDVGEEEEREEGTTDPEESPEYWNEQWRKAMRSSVEMEKLVKRSMEVSAEFHKDQMAQEQESEERSRESSSSTVAVEPEQNIDEDWGIAEDRGPKIRVKKSKIPPELFLRAAVRPFTYRNLVKEIVLIRHAIIDGDISTKG